MISTDPSSMSRSRRAATAQHRRNAYGRALCRSHGGALLTMACVLLDDVDVAGEIVAATIAAACRRGPRTSPVAPATRIRLAQSVYWRCLGRLATVERFAPALPAADPRRVRPASALAVLNLDQRAITALTLFGAHNARQIAGTLRKPVPELAGQIREALTSITSYSVPVDHRVRLLRTT